MRHTKVCSQKPRCIQFTAICARWSKITGAAPIDWADLSIDIILIFLSITLINHNSTSYFGHKLPNDNQCSIRTRPSQWGYSLLGETISNDGNVYPRAPVPGGAFNLPMTANYSACNSDTPWQWVFWALQMTVVRPHLKGWDGPDSAVIYGDDNLSAKSSFMAITNS